MRQAIEKIRYGVGDILTVWWALLCRALLSYIRAKPRFIKDVPKGFDEQDVNMAYPASKWKSESVAEFLAPSSQNEERPYQIGIAFVGKSGHAEIIILDGDGLSDIGPPSYLDLTVGPLRVDQDDLTRIGPHKLLKADNIRLRVLHLRNANDGNGSLELVLEARPNVRHYRYVALYRILTTERRLKHLALTSCPEKYTLLVDDCATFCYSFLKALLDHLRKRGKYHGGIGRDEHRHQKRLLERQIHVKDGLAGAVEWRAVSPVQSE